MVTIGFTLRDYIEKLFPDKKVIPYVSSRVNANDRYIQISTVLKDDMDIHYEYFQGHVELHLEGKYQTLGLINKLQSETSDNPFLSWMEWQGYENARCLIDKPIDNWGDVVAAFKAMMEIFDPIIEKVYNEQMNNKKTSEIQAEVVPVRALIEEK